jgi:hypothetical protein
MLPETESAVAGMFKGAGQGAALAFFTVGAIAVIALAATGGFAAVPAFSMSPIAPVAFAVGNFLWYGALATPFGAALGAVYEGYNNFVEEKAIQHQMKEAVKVTKESELVDIMHATERMTPSFQQVIAENPPNFGEENSPRQSATQRLQEQRRHSDLTLNRA